MSTLPNWISLSHLSVDAEKCTRCGACKAACPEGAITSSFDELRERFFKKEPGRR